MYGVPVAPPKPALQDLLADEVRRVGDENALARFDAVMARCGRPENGDGLNRLAYQFAEAGRVATGIAILKRAIAVFPRDGNLYDSLGELYLMAGDNASSATAYRRAIELDPTNTNAKEMLKKATQK
jgi:predicted Zn-dependent protease